jgi:hypothetical protein
MNNSNEIEINLTDIHLDYDHDYLQIITGNEKLIEFYSRLQLNFPPMFFF